MRMEKKIWRKYVMDLFQVRWVRLDISKKLDVSRKQINAVLIKSDAILIKSDLIGIKSDHIRIKSDFVQIKSDLLKIELERI